MMPSYVDFELEIGAGLGRDYRVAVLRSPAGEAQATMRFPYDELQLNSRLKDLQIALLRSGGRHRTVLTREEEAVQELGRARFDALLAGEIRSLYDVSRARTAQAGKGLRIKLREVSSPPINRARRPRPYNWLCLAIGAAARQEGGVACGPTRSGIDSWQ